MCFELEVNKEEEYCDVEWLIKEEYIVFDVTK